MKARRNIRGVRKPLSPPELYRQKLAKPPPKPLPVSVPVAKSKNGIASPLAAFVLIPAKSLWAYKTKMTDSYLGGMEALNFRVAVGDTLPEDLSPYSLVVLWSHGWEGNDDTGAYCDKAMAARRAAEAAGIPVFSAIPTAVGHDKCFAAWKSAGVPCPDYADIDNAASMGFPVVLRVRHKLSRGRMMFLAGSQDAVTSLRRMYPDLDLAVQYIDTKGVDGLYRKYRSYVVGDQIIPRQIMASADWRVSLGNTVGVSCPAVAEENKAFLAGPHPWDATLLQAAKAVGMDAGALDYSFTPKGIIIWEINACYGMAGEGDSSKDQAFRQATSLSVTDVVYKEQQMGLIAAREMLFRSLRLEQNQVTSLLWTGGYDSTFRLCQLLSEGRTVLPIYVCNRIDNRRSVSKELTAMARLAPLIRSTVNGGTLLKTLCVGEPGGPLISYALPGDDEVTRMARVIGYGNVGRERMGSQYEPLCRFAKYWGPTEIGIEIGGRAEKLLRCDVSVEGGEHRLTSEPLTDRNLEIFRPFSFPLIRMTKRDMQQVAKAGGYEAALALTWTCWLPKSNGLPCGRCEMCRRRVAEVSS